MKILVVDDEFVALTKMETLLSDYGECDTASDGMEALVKFQQAYLNSEEYDLITIDIDMPSLNGLQLLKRITSDEENLYIPKAKKIIVTAEGSPNNVYQAAENNCDAFLVKPVKKDTLEMKLKNIGIVKKLSYA